RTRSDCVLQPKTKWMVKEKEKTEENINLLIHSLGIEPLTAKLLIQRGIHTIEQAQLFLYGKDEFHSPYLFEHMEKAVERIKRAIKQGEKILIYGDYDADGVTSTSVILLTIRELGGDVYFYLPNRFREGYGLNEDAVREG